MRDFIVIFIVLFGSLAALRRPWIGVILWTWLSTMNPHRYTYGVAYDAPLAATAAICTVLGLLMTKDRESPFKSVAVVLLFFLVVWITVSWLFGLDVVGDYPQWKKVMKVDLMIFVALALLRTKRHIFLITWVAAGSLAFLGVKGGIFTLTTGGDMHVYGPPGSFIEDNNEFAVALVMTIPLLRFLQLQIESKWVRVGMTCAMLLCAASALGTQSRGALLAISAMALTLWWRAKNKFQIGMLLLLAALPLIAFMPQQWSDRMATINHYEADRSAMGRISAWWEAWNIALHYPAGVGFNPGTPELFAKYSPYPDYVHAAHSIYFQILGNHGFIGLLLFLSIWIYTWRSAGWLRNQKKLLPETQWVSDLGAMCQVSLVGYAVGGAFLSLAYFDLPYNVMVIVVLARIWLEKESWKKESVDWFSKWRVDGVAMPGKAS